MDPVFVNPRTLQKGDRVVLHRVGDPDSTGPFWTRRKSFPLVVHGDVNQDSELVSFVGRGPYRNGGWSWWASLSNDNTISFGDGLTFNVSKQ